MNTQRNKYNYKMLGVVTLYNPEPEEAASNIKRYISDVDALIIWDNSPLEKNLKGSIITLIGDEAAKVLWQGNGQNRCIAPAINFAWHYAKEYGYDLLLIMDQDSRWEDFASYRKDVENLYKDEAVIFTPYVEGCDDFDILETKQKKHFFINSGAIIPIEILQTIKGVDEIAFPLDAVDHDIAYSAREKGYEIICLTNHKLHHSLGQKQRMGILNMLTPNYNSFRTYSMTRSHIICYRKHRNQVESVDKQYLYKEILLMKFVRIVFAEPEKCSRLWAYLKGITSGLLYKIP